MTGDILCPWGIFLELCVPKMIIVSLESYIKNGLSLQVCQLDCCSDPALVQGAAERTPRFGTGIASGGERVQWWGVRRRTAVYVPFSVYSMAWSGEHRAFIVEEFIKNGESPVATQRAFRIRQIWLPATFFSGATSKQRFTNNVPKFWKLWRRRYDRKLLPLHLKWFSKSWTTTERGYISLSIFKTATWVMFCSKHVDVKRHSVYFPEIKKPLPHLLWFWIY